MKEFCKVSPVKYGGLFSKKGGLFFMGGLMIESCQGGSFKNTFFNNLNSVDKTNFPSHVGIFT